MINSKNQLIRVHPRYASNIWDLWGYIWLTLEEPHWGWDRETKCKSVATGEVVEWYLGDKGDHPWFLPLEETEKAERE